MSKINENKANVKTINYSESLKKKFSRWDCIIVPYGNIFGVDKMPNTKEYWAICNDCSNGTNIKKGSEIDHVTNIGFIKSKQFNGVEIDKEIADRNAQIEEGNWHHGDFYEVMANCQARGNFNPGVINIDTGFKSRKASELCSDILFMLTKENVSDVFVILNYVLEYMGLAESQDKIMEMLLSNDRYNYAQEYGDWQTTPFPYIYNGTEDNSGTVMSTIGFVR